jgi:hypothetical protein
MQVPLELRDEVSTELVAYNQALMGSSSAAASAATNPSFFDIYDENDDEYASTSQKSKPKPGRKNKFNTEVPKQVKKTITLKSQPQPLPHGVQIIKGLNHDALITMPKGFLFAQLDLRGYPLTKSDLKAISRKDFSSMILAVDSGDTTSLPANLKKKLSKRQTTA